MLLKKMAVIDSFNIGSAQNFNSKKWSICKRLKLKSPILCPPDVKSWLTGKDSDAGKDWGQEEKGASLTQWTWVYANSRRHWRTGKLGVLHPWCCKESDMTEQLNNKRLYVCNHLEKMSSWVASFPSAWVRTELPCVNLQARLETHKHAKTDSMPLSLEMICYETLLLAPSCSLSFLPFSFLGAFSGRDYLLPLL